MKSSNLSTSVFSLTKKNPKPLSPQNFHRLKAGLIIARGGLMRLFINLTILPRRTKNNRIKLDLTGFGNLSGLARGKITGNF